MSIIGWVRQGDKAACGGVVAQGCPTDISHGQAYTFQGAKMLCRKKCVIADGYAKSILTNGFKQVLHGMRTTGLCPLISTLNGLDGDENHVVNTRPQQAVVSPRKPKESEEVTRVLESTFAFDQLTRVANSSTKGEFVMLLVPVFGYDIPAKTYIKLYDALRSGGVVNAKIKISNRHHYPAEFDNITREIRVDPFAAKAAAEHEYAAWELLTVLMHEFGHYIDAVLRQDLADKNKYGRSTLAGDAPDDEGAKFAYQMAFFDFSQSDETVFATYTSPEYSGPLKVNYSEARQAIQQAQGEQAQRLEGKAGSREFFPAKGEHEKEKPGGSFGHQSIEKALLKADKFFGDKEITLRQIYFGNWLRDNSQILDPKIIRATWAPKDLSQKLSRESLTQIINILAEEEFVKKPEEQAMFLVTPEILGVYRAVEHIDNPTNNTANAADPRSIDPDFEAPATKALVSVDPLTSMKRYISESSRYMQTELNNAKAAGPNAKGFRHFGAALHVLEDYFAHSNFVELSLRKMGFPVLPWTSTAAGKHSLPVVTGMFETEDAIASLIVLVAELAFKVKHEFKPLKAGERNKADRIMLILLREHNDPKMLKRFEDFLHLRDKVADAPGSVLMQKFLYYTISQMGRTINYVFNNLLTMAGNNIDDAQVLIKGDPNTSGSTDPSHTQLAKDHDDHPFHVLAAELAQVAISKVGKAMANHWQGIPGDNPTALAAAYLVHPFDCKWQDEQVLDWAQMHPKEVTRGKTSLWWDRLRAEHEDELRRKIKKMQKRNAEIWDYVQRNYEALTGEKNKVTPQ
jgi:uncharacterized Zn-binding protein involved in type VI secretion